MDLREITRYLSWFDISTSLLEGWEGYDDDLRRAQPLLDLQAWEKALHGSGFHRIESFPGRGTVADELGFHVLLAQVPGSPPGRRQGKGAPVATADAARESEATVRVEAAELFRSRFDGASPQEQDELLVSLVREQIARMLRLSPSEPIGRRKRLMELGLDSLMAVELRNRLNTKLSLAEPLPSTLIFDHPTVDAIVELLRGKLTGGSQEQEAATEEAGSEDGRGSRTREEVAQLTDQEAEERLLSRLESLEGDG